MSYSFQVQGESKHDAVAKVDLEMQKVISAQPVHDKDGPTIVAGARKLIEMLGEDEDKAVKVEVSGWISTEAGAVIQVQAQIAASLVSK